MDQDVPAPRVRVLRGGAVDEPVDPRVSAVLAVLGGRTPGDVAREWSVDTALLSRWVRDFVDAGTAQVTNRPGEAAAAQRDRFLAAFAHEVRTPLAVARGWVEMLKDDELPAAMSTQAVGRLDEALERLAERSLDVQLLASASMGRLALEPRRVPVGELVDRLPGPPLVGGDGPDTTVVVDPELFRRVLRDLWEAASAQPTPRSLRLTAATVGPWREVCIHRDADPIDPQHLQALFDPFDLNDDSTGITIGLYLARALAVAHRGTIGVDQDDEGAVLWVRVPVDRVSQPHAPEEH